MRKHLNNPMFVLPVAILVLVFLLYRIGVFDGIELSTYFDKQQSFMVSESKTVPVLEIEASRIAKAFTKERWLPANWQQFANMKRELFVADYQLEDDLLPSIDLAIKVDAETGEVEIEKEELTSYIAENMGLDRTGFFVRFGIIRKREGDDVKTKDGQALTLGKIAMPDQGQLNGSGNYLKVEDVVKELSLEATSPVERAEEAMPKALGEAIPEVYREGDIVKPELVERRPVRRDFASAVILGGVNPMDIYREGDLVSRVPAIGLAGVTEAAVELIDRDGNIYELKLRR